MKALLASGCTALALVATGCGPSIGAGRDAAVPAGMVRAVADTLGLSLGVDKTWTVQPPTFGHGDIAFAAWREPPRPSEVPTSAEPGLVTRMNFFPAVTITVLRGDTHLPTRQQLSARSGTTHAAIDSVDDVATPIGDARLFITHVRYEQDGPTAYSDHLFFRLRGDLVMLTVSGPEKQAADDAMQATIPTLRDVG